MLRQVVIFVALAGFFALGLWLPSSRQQQQLTTYQSPTSLPSSSPSLSTNSASAESSLPPFVAPETSASSGIPPFQPPSSAPFSAPTETEGEIEEAEEQNPRPERLPAAAPPPSQEVLAQCAQILASRGLERMGIFHRPKTANPQLRDLVITKESLRRKDRLFTLEISQELSTYFPDVDPFLHTKYKTCALVGNSGCLLNTRHGPEIDAHDAVMRFNNAPVEGYEPYVGAKQTIRFGTFITSSWLSMPADHHVYVGFHPRHVKWFLNAKSTKLGTLLHIEPELANSAWSEINREGKWCTTGFIATYFALQVCDQINLYGFTSGDHSTCKYHYFDESSIESKNTNHKWSAERVKLNTWHAAGALTLHD